MAKHTFITDRRSPASAAIDRRSVGAALFAVVTGSGITAGAAASVADLVPASPDAELLDLGVRLTAEWRHMTTEIGRLAGKLSDERLDAMMDSAGYLVDLIEHAEAQTVAGLAVKALAVSWCNDGDEIDENRFNPLAGATTDARIAASIVRDLLRIGGRAAA